MTRARGCGGRGARSTETRRGEDSRHFSTTNTAHQSLAARVEDEEESRIKLLGSNSFLPRTTRRLFAAVLLDPLFLPLLTPPPSAPPSLQPPPYHALPRVQAPAWSRGAYAQPLLPPRRRRRPRRLVGVLRRVLVREDGVAGAERPSVRVQDTVRVEGYWIIVSGLGLKRDVACTTTDEGALVNADRGPTRVCCCCFSRTTIAEGEWSFPSSLFAFIQLSLNPQAQTSRTARRSLPRSQPLPRRRASPSSVRSSLSPSSARAASRPPARA